MVRTAVAYVVCLILYVLLDAGWFMVAVPKLYKPEIGELLGPVRAGAAVAFYILYAAGLVFFAVGPALAASSAGLAVLNGAMVGLICYGTYDLTNQATLRIWSMKVTVSDIAWGLFASALAATIGYAVTARLVRSA